MSGKFSEEPEMKEMMWAYGVVLLLVVSEAWSLDSGTNQSTSESSNTTTLPTLSRNTEIKDDVSRKVFFNQGSEGRLICSNKTWDEMMYTIWKIDFKRSGQCAIGFSSPGQSDNTCQNGKALHNTTKGESYLFIPNISNGDEGVYKCESVYKGGRDSVKFILSVNVRPKVTAWLEQDGKKRVAVCKAEEGKPAASLVWRNTGNSPFVPTNHTTVNPDGSFTVTSRLELLESEDTSNLTCAVTGYWAREQKTAITETRTAHGNWMPLISGIIIIIIVIVFGLSYLLIRYRIRIRHCWQSSAVPSESKSPPTEDVEEVEPYASYTQRVNSIYNSSADLFT